MNYVLHFDAHLLPLIRVGSHYVYVTLKDSAISFPKGVLTGPSRLTTERLGSDKWSLYLSKIVGYILLQFCDKNLYFSYLISFNNSTFIFYRKETH